MNLDTGLGKTLVALLCPFCELLGGLKPTEASENSTKESPRRRSSSACPQ